MRRLFVRPTIAIWILSMGLTGSLGNTWTFADPPQREGCRPKTLRAFLLDVREAFRRHSLTTFTVNPSQAELLRDAGLQTIAYRRPRIRPSNATDLVRASKTIRNTWPDFALARAIERVMRREVKAGRRDLRQFVSMRGASPEILRWAHDPFFLDRGNSEAAIRSLQFGIPRPDQDLLPIRIDWASEVNSPNSMSQRPLVLPLPLEQLRALGFSEIPGPGRVYPEVILRPIQTPGRDRAYMGQLSSYLAARRTLAFSEFDQFMGTHVVPRSQRVRYTDASGIRREGIVSEFAANVHYALSAASPDSLAEANAIGFLSGNFDGHEYNYAVNSAREVRLFDADQAFDAGLNVHIQSAHDDNIGTYLPTRYTPRLIDRIRNPRFERELRRSSAGALLTETEIQGILLRREIILEHLSTLSP